MGNVVMQKQVLVAIALLALFFGCDSQEGGTAAPGTAPVAAELPKPKEVSVNSPPILLGKPSISHDLAIGEKVYRNTCGLCHRLGLKGAPRLGDKEDWMSRLAQGNEVFYNHAINGYRGSKGFMPSRGSNAKLSENEVKAAVDYMVRYSVPKPHGPLGSHVFSSTAKPSTIR
ncbi:MAG TPA: c-type cytochrome [Gallionella sp.]|nr:c-type cytochrome [Gallionella sp.]